MSKAPRCNENRGHTNYYFLPFFADLFRYAHIFNNMNIFPVLHLNKVTGKKYICSLQLYKNNKVK